MCVCVIACNGGERVSEVDRGEKERLRPSLLSIVSVADSSTLSSTQWLYSWRHCVCVCVCVCVCMCVCVCV